MAVEIYLPGNAFPTSNIKNFSVQEDATPIEPSSSFGGVGRIMFDINENADTPLLVGGITLVDGTRGKTSGTIAGLMSSNGDVSVTSDSALGLFNTDRTVEPFVGTLTDAIQYYCDLVGIPNDVVIDTTIASRSVIYPGWKGNVWVGIKQILSREQIEMALVFNRIHVRPLRLLHAHLDRATTLGWAIEKGDSAQNIEINYYNHTYGTLREIYPLTTEEPTIYVVGAGEIQTVTATVNASLFSINQPVVSAFVYDQSYAGTNGVYSVVGNDNLPITPAQWTADGGSISVAMTDDPSVIEITIVGARSTTYAPYRIAMSSGSGNDYNSLHITGTAVTWEKRTVRLNTGTVNTSDEVGVTVDNPFITTLSEAYSLGIKTAQAYAGLNYTVSGVALDINRNGDVNGLVQSTISDFNSWVAPGTTIAAFNTTWTGQTVEDFNIFWQLRVDGLFENQLFGNAVGARILRDEANFRVISATTTDSEVQFSATLDTLIGDFNPLWTSDTIASFNTQFSGRTSKDFSVVPLRKA